MTISSAQGTLRATAQLDLYLYLGQQLHRRFSLVSLLFFFGGFLVGMSKGHFHFDTQTSCVHTPLPLHFFLPTFHQRFDPWRSSVNHESWLNARYLCISPFSIAPKKMCLVWEWVGHKSVNQFWRFFSPPADLA
jgi:hypothetical protein